MEFDFNSANNTPIEEATVEELRERLDLTRRAFAFYQRSEGCACCRDSEGHDKAEKDLGLLLEAERYDDDSGFNWRSYIS